MMRAARRRRGCWRASRCTQPWLAAQDETRWAKVLDDSAEVISLDTTSITPLGDSTYRVWERSVSRRRGAHGEIRAKLDGEAPTGDGVGSPAGAGSWATTALAIKCGRSQTTMVS